MKLLAKIFLAGLLFAGAAHAQWVTKTYPLVSGWNGVWLAGDASYTTVSSLFASNAAVTEVWRWNPNPDKTEFTQTPSAPTANSDEWTIWKRDGSETGLSRMVGNSAYLIRCSSAVSVPIKQRVQPPLATWLISGGNFLGFPSGTASPPKMSSYFASYPSASTTVLATPSKIYKYIGGELGSGNPMLVSPGPKPWILTRPTGSTSPRSGISPPRSNTRSPARRGSPLAGRRRLVASASPTVRPAA
jgi:hypothetical protein